MAAVRGRLEKVERLAAALSRCAPEEVEIAVDYLTGGLPQGRIGVAWATIEQARHETSAAAATLTLAAVDAAFGRIAAARGGGSSAARSALLAELFRQATAEEQDFLTRLLLGELRQGALEGVVADAVARAAKVGSATIRRAWMMAGSLPAVARAALVEGEAGLARFNVQLMRPVQPMLADSADNIDAALDLAGEEVALEWKLDGARIQAHKAGDEVRVFSRALREVTRAVPEVVAVVQALPAATGIFDGEAIALRADGSPLPFQVTMSRFGRKRGVDERLDALPLSTVLFDCLYLDDVSLLDEPQHRRFDALCDQAEGLVVRHLRRPSREQAAEFVAAAHRAGHEGVMVKSLAAPYAAGRRGRSWIKVKAARTLDLVILAAEWGSGRRKGWLSNLHLGARDPASGLFVMLGKTFKGLTDEMLAWQTQHLLTLETTREAHVVHVRPELVVEIAFNEIQTSPRYPGGMALRFARVKGYRPDKSAADADTIDTVRALHG